MTQGLRTVVYPAPDLGAGKAWYRSVLGIDPYFDGPFYVGFAVGGFELGLVPDGAPGAVGAVAYWGVPDAAEALGMLERLGAAVHRSVTDVGDGVKVASVLDPFGNVFAVIESPRSDPAPAR